METGCFTGRSPGFVGGNFARQIFNEAHKFTCLSAQGSSDSIIRAISRHAINLTTELWVHDASESNL